MGLFDGGGGGGGSFNPFSGGGGGGGAPSFNPFGGGYSDPTGGVPMMPMDPFGGGLSARGMGGGGFGGWGGLGGGMGGIMGTMGRAQASGGRSAPTNGLAGPIEQPRITDLASLKDAMANGQGLGMSELVQAMPMYQGIRDKDGNVMDPYKFDYSGSKGYNTMSDMAFSKGPTDVYKNNANLIDMNTNHAVGDFNTQSDAGLSSGLGSLAMSGGLNTGSRERLADSNQLQRLTGAQDIYGGGARSKAGALIADSQMKNDMLKTVTGYDVNAENLNKNAAINDVYNKNQADLMGWGKLGDIYGSGVAADAQMALANKKDPGFLGINGLWDSIGSFGKGVIPGRGDR